MLYFLAGSFDARYFFGCKISGSGIFLGSQYDALSDPPSRILQVVPPPHPPGSQSTLALTRTKLKSM